MQILQTAASIENLAVATYKTALTLPYIGGSVANPVVTKFAQVTMGQHAQHAAAFNGAAKSLGGKAQTKLFASVMGIEAQHVAVLLAVQALLKTGAPQLISLTPGTAAALPAAAGSVGFPNSFYPTDKAVPARQGAVK